VYRQKNAHAWVEVFFPGYGWIQFEPTSSRPTVDHGDVQKSEVSPDAAQPSPTPTMGTDEPSVATATPDVLNPASNGQQPPQLDRIDGGSGTPRWLLIAGAITGAIALSGGALWLAWSWSLRGLAPSSALYLRLLRFGRFAGVQTSPTATPHEVAESFAQSIPAVRTQAERTRRSRFRAPAFGKGRVERNTGEFRKGDLPSRQAITVPRYAIMKH